MNHLMIASRSAGSTEYTYDLVTLDEAGFGAQAGATPEICGREFNLHELSSRDEVDDSRPLLLCHQILDAFDENMPAPNSAESMPIWSGVSAEAVRLAIVTSFLAVSLTGVGAYCAWQLLGAP